MKNFILPSLVLCLLSFASHAGNWTNYPVIHLPRTNDTFLLAHGTNTTAPLSTNAQLTWLDLLLATKTNALTGTLTNNTTGNAATATTATNSPLGPLGSAATNLVSAFQPANSTLSNLAATAAITNLIAPAGFHWSLSGGTATLVNDVGVTNNLQAALTNQGLKVDQWLASTNPSTHALNFSNLTFHLQPFAIESNGVDVARATTKGNTPGISGGIGAGTSPTVSITGTDLAGHITVTTDTDPAEDRLATITFTAPFPNGTRVFLQAIGGNASDYISATGGRLIPVTESTSAFSIEPIDGNAWSASTSYEFNYMVIGY